MNKFIFATLIISTSLNASFVSKALKYKKTGLGAILTGVGYSEMKYRSLLKEERDFHQHFKETYGQNSENWDIGQKRRFAYYSNYYNNQLERYYKYSFSKTSRETKFFVGDKMEKLANFILGSKD